ncbi:hypothetical protein PsorP6_001436 [Peronosclerospora sorghi]|uniref:Uncharacterized protein n=1 Tax=Peronosclerospora sorghi TaxID=230839 RepID=A0ACC0WT45_9STRA|nr:hypothetical protein PsorP6_001436 [Peronosclerospora sorghi]
MLERHDLSQKQQLRLLTLILLRLRVSIRERHYLTSSALVLTRESPWHTLDRDGGDREFLNTVGLTRGASIIWNEGFRNITLYFLSQVDRGSPRVWRISEVFWDSYCTIMQASQNAKPSANYSGDSHLLPRVCF